MVLTLVLTAIAAAVSLVARHVLGFGFSLTFVPLASFFLPAREAVLAAILLEILIGLALAVELRDEVRLLDALKLQGAALAGIAAGIVALRLVSPALLFRLCLVPLLALAVVLCARPELAMRRSRAKLVAAGVGGGGDLGLASAENADAEHGGEGNGIAVVPDALGIVKSDEDKKDRKKKKKRA